MGAAAHATGRDALRRVGRGPAREAQRRARGDTAPLALAGPVRGVLPAGGGVGHAGPPLRAGAPAEYLAGVEAHKMAFARDLQEGMIPSGRLPGYFELSTDEGWRITLDLAQARLGLADGWGVASEASLVGDLAPFAWAYRNSGFCVVTLYDKDIRALRDDLLFVAKREGVELRWRRTAA